jgi:hypothetical protein
MVEIDYAHSIFSRGLIQTTCKQEEARHKALGTPEDDSAETEAATAAALGRGSLGDDDEEELTAATAAHRLVLASVTASSAADKDSPTAASARAASQAAAVHALLHATAGFIPHLAKTSPVIIVPLIRDLKCVEILLAAAASPAPRVVNVALLALGDALREYAVLGMARHLSKAVFLALPIIAQSTSSSKQPASNPHAVNSAGAAAAAYLLSEAVGGARDDARPHLSNIMAALIPRVKAYVGDQASESTEAGGSGTSRAANNFGLSLVLLLKLQPLKLS